MKFVMCTKFQVNRMNCVESRRGGRGSKASWVKCTLLVMDARKHFFFLPKLQSNQKNTNNCEFLIIFTQKIEILTANSFFIIFYDDVINADVTYIVQKMCSLLRNSGTKTFCNWSRVKNFRTKKSRWDSPNTHPP